MSKLYIVMVGLPARGKSTLAHRLCEGFVAEGVEVKLFNNGELRRAFLGTESSLPEFYHPENKEGRELREQLARKNVQQAVAFLQGTGQVAILDATNASLSRRKMLQQELKGAPILFIECVNEDRELLRTCVQCKAKLPEFSTLSKADAIQSFLQRIDYYSDIYSPLVEEPHFLRVDTLRNAILYERAAAELPYYLYIRTVIVADFVRGFYLARHGESEYNVEDRIGGDPSLTHRGREQAQRLAEQFAGKDIPYVFTSKRERSIETAQPVLAQHPESIHVILPELDEINAGICENLRYADIKQQYPEEYAAREKDKYHYIYPSGEGYCTMLDRVEQGLRKALFLSGGKPGMLIIGHQAVNRTILSLFLFRKTKEVPYIYIPQNQYFYFEATYRRKLFELVRFMEPQGEA